MPVFGDKQPMVVIRDDESRNSIDKVCVVLFPEKGLVGNAGSLQRLMKHIEPIDEIPASMVSECKELLTEQFSVEQLSYIERQLRLPEKRVFDELVLEPKTLRGYMPKLE